MHPFLIYPKKKLNLPGLLAHQVPKPISYECIFIKITVNSSVNIYPNKKIEPL